MVFSASEKRDMLRVAIRRIALAKSLSLRAKAEERRQCRQFLRNDEMIDAAVAEMSGRYSAQIADVLDGARDFPDGLLKILDWLKENWAWLQEVIQFIIDLFADPDSLIAIGPAAAVA